MPASWMRRCHRDRISEFSVFTGLNLVNPETSCKSCENPLWLKPEPFLVCHKHCSELIQTFRILIVEAADDRTVEIEYAQQSFTVKQRHHDLGVRSHVA